MTHPTGTAAALVSDSLWPEVLGDNEGYLDTLVHMFAQALDVTSDKQRHRRVWA